MNMRLLPLLPLLAITPVFGVPFEKLSVSPGGSERPATDIISVEPLVVQSIQYTPVFSRLVWGKNGAIADMIVDSDLPPNPGEVSNNVEAFQTDAAGGNLYVVGSLKLGGVTKSDGYILKYNSTTTTEFSPRARAAISGGEDHPFTYNLMSAAQNGTLVVIGQDNGFSHFVLKVTENNVQVIAEENVTDFPGGTGKFTRFAGYPEISPDGSILVFRGSEGSGNPTGLFSWTQADGVQVIADSTMTVPGTSTLFGNLEASNTPVVFGADNTLFLKHTGTGKLLSYKNGVMTTMLSNGDMVGGTAVSTLTQTNDFKLDGLKPLSNGDVIYRDDARILRFRAGAWSEVIQLASGLPQYHFFEGEMFIGEQHTYFTYRVYDLGTNTSTRYVLRVDYEGNAPEGVYQFDSADFSGNLTTPGKVFVNSDSLIIGSSTKYYKTQLATLPAVTVPGYSPLSFSSYVAGLPANLRGTTDDADNDGIDNLTEYGLKLDPGVPNGLGDGFTISLQPGHLLGIAGSDDLYARLEVNVHAEATDITVTPRLLEALGGPDAPGENVMPVGTPTLYNDRLVQFYRSVMKVDDLSKAFFRVKVELN